MTREEARKAAYYAYEAAYVTFKAELDRINKEQQ
jgi:hypothetical protein